MERYPDAASEIKAWVGIVEAVRWHNFAEVRGTFKDADPVDGYVQFRWEVFNVPNLTRFNAQGVGSSLLTSLTQSPNNFGAYTSLLTQPRVMQFALRYEF